MSEASVALLGVKGGPAIKPGSNMPCSHLVKLAGKNIIIDAGLGVSRGICDQGVELTEIDMIIITHLHSDHYLELGPLFHTAWTAGLNKPIKVIGPKGLQDYWDGFLLSMKFDIDLRIEDEGRCDLSALFAYEEIGEDEIFRSDDLNITTMKNLHPPIEESYAIRIQTSEKAVTLSGDTTYMPELAEFAKNSDVLVHEALLLKGVDALCKSLGVSDDRLKNHLLRSHTAAGDVGKIASKAEVKTLALNHLVPGADPSITEQDWVDAAREHWQGELHIGKDGMKIEF
jgi:ribonuclease BN (tRNA processing enzyme)